MRPVNDLTTLAIYCPYVACLLPHPGDPITDAPHLIGFERSRGVGEPVHVGPWCNGHVRHSETGGGARASARQHNTDPPKEGKGE